LIVVYNVHYVFGKYWVLIVVYNVYYVFGEVTNEKIEQIVVIIIKT
jgi:hypothetical protein